MVPCGLQDQKLQRSKILKVAKDLIEERMKNQQYDPVKGAQVSQIIFDAQSRRVEEAVAPCET